MRIEREELSDSLFDEIVPLAQKCWNENTVIKADTCAYYGKREYEVEPDKDLYLGLDAKKALVILSIRNEGKLVGYAIGFTYNSPHHCKIPCGHADSIYVEPEYRSEAGIPLVIRLEKELRAMGAKAMGWPVSRNAPLYEVLVKMGYVGDDIIMEKVLCAS